MAKFFNSQVWCSMKPLSITRARNTVQLPVLETNMPITARIGYALTAILRRLLLLPTLSRPTLQVGVENSHVDKELLFEVSSGAAAPALLPPLGVRVQFLDSKQLGAAPYLVVHGDHMPRPPLFLCAFFPSAESSVSSQSPLTRVSTWWSVTTAKVRAKGRGLDRIRPRILNGSHSLSRCALPPPRDCRAHTVLAH